jgi:hypothetical protein
MMASPEQPHDRRGNERAAACILPSRSRPSGRLRGARLRLAPGTLPPGHWPRAMRPRAWPQATGHSHAAQWPRRRPGVHATRRAAMQNQPAQYGLVLGRAINCIVFQFSICRFFNFNRNKTTCLIQ